MPDRPCPVALVLGASDPEMAAIADLAREVGAAVAWATDAQGQPVRTETAYRAAGLSAPLPEAVASVLLVECDGDGLRAALPRGRAVTICDHHRPGDPGYGRPPAEFLSASSLGQVIAALVRAGAVPGWPTCLQDPPQAVGTFELGRLGGGPAWVVAVHARGLTYAGAKGQTRTLGLGAEVPEALVHTAAADHCLAAAYRGACPGVDPDALMAWRVASRAAFQRRPVADVLADVARARMAIRQAPRVRLGADAATEVADLRGASIAELPEAAAREGVAVLATPGRHGERVKVVLQAATAAQVRAFRAWAEAQGWTDAYGDPARGFAGAYLP